VFQADFRECMKHFDIVVSERRCPLNPFLIFEGVYCVHVIKEWVSVLLEKVAQPLTKS
jgi:hypothetical protein